MNEFVTSLELWNNKIDWQSENRAKTLYSSEDTDFIILWSFTWHILWDFKQSRWKHERTLWETKGEGIT